MKWVPGGAEGGRGEKGAGERETAGEGGGLVPESVQPSLGAREEILLQMGKTEVPPNLGMGVVMLLMSTGI